MTTSISCFQKVVAQYVSVFYLVKCQTLNTQTIRLVLFRTETWIVAANFRVDVYESWLNSKGPVVTFKPDCWNVAIATQAYWQAGTWATPVPAIKVTHPVTPTVAPGLVVR